MAAIQEPKAAEVVPQPAPASAPAPVEKNISDMDRLVQIAADLVPVETVRQRRLDPTDIVPKGLDNDKWASRFVQYKYDEIAKAMGDDWKLVTERLFGERLNGPHGKIATENFTTMGGERLVILGDMCLMVQYKKVWREKEEKKLGPFYAGVNDLYNERVPLRGANGETMSSDSKLTTSVTNPGEVVLTKNKAG